MGTTDLLLLATFVAVIALYLRQQRSSKNRSLNGLSFPPGPFAIPLIGTLSFFRNRPHETAMHNWKPRFGPLVGFNVLIHKAVAISDFQLIKQAANDPAFAGRPPVGFIHERSGGKSEGIIFNTGRDWQEQKRFTLRRLRDFGFGTKSMEVIVQDEVSELVRRLKVDADAKRPVSTDHKFNSAVINALWTIVAGERFQQDDPQLDRIFQLFKDFTQPSGLAMVAGSVPWVRKFVPDWIHRFSKVMNVMHEIDGLIRPRIVAHTETHVPGQPRDFIDAYIDEVKVTTDPESSFHTSKQPQTLSFTIFDLFLAGAETVSTTLHWILLYMAVHQDVQKKLAGEIDRVVGNSRLPSLADRPNMPFTEAVIHEVMRVRPLVPMTFQYTTEDVYDFHGHWIPKDTMIGLNIYSVHYDVDLWGDPDNFRPERWVSEDGSQFERREGFFSFSLGKRVCLGERLARDELFLFTTALFQAFQVDPDLSNGQGVPSVESVSKGPRMPLPAPHKLLLSARS